MRGGIGLWQRFQVLRYVVVGGANTAFAYLVYALGLLAGLSVPLASLVSLVFSIVVSFASHGSLVFGNLSPLAFVRYLVNWLVMYLLYVGVVLGLMEVGINPYLGGLAATVVTTGLSFITLGRMVFKPPRTGVNASQSSGHPSPTARATGHD